MEIKSDKQLSYKKSTGEVKGMRSDGIVLGNNIPFPELEPIQGNPLNMAYPRLNKPLLQVVGWDVV